MDKESTPQIIRDAALEKFRRFGIRRVTMDEIARDLGISKKTLYRHYADKEALVSACVDHLSGTILSAVREALGSDRPVEERLLGVMKGMSLLPRLISNEMIADLPREYPHLWRTFDERRRSVLAGFERLFEDGVRQGRVRRGIHPKVATRILMAVVGQVLVPEVMSLGEFTPFDAVRTLFTLTTQGIFVDPPDLDEIFFSARREGGSEPSGTPS